MSITIEDIKSAGEIPESFFNISPGRAIFYLSKKNGIEKQINERIARVFDQCKTQREGFSLEIKEETTTNVFLEDCIVARRLNLGSLLQYNLLIGRLNCDESADAFVKEFFNLHSRDDEALKFINKKRVRPLQSNDYDGSYSPSMGMSLGMIVMRPKTEDEDAEEDEAERTPEQIEDDNKLIQAILAHADKYKIEISFEMLRKFTGATYVLTDNPDDCKLIFSEEHDFWLKAGTMVKLELTKLQKAFYLLLLAHPLGIEVKRFADYREDLLGFYYLVLKKGDLDAIDRTIDNFLDCKDLGIKFKQSRLSELKSKINNNLQHCILNRTCQQPFLVQNTKGVLHIDLPRKFFEWQEKGVRFEIKE